MSKNLNLDKKIDQKRLFFVKNRNLSKIDLFVKNRKLVKKFGRKMWPKTIIFCESSELDQKSIF